MSKSFEDFLYDAFDIPLDQRTYEDPNDLPSTLDSPTPLECILTKEPSEICQCPPKCSQSGRKLTQKGPNKGLNSDKEEANCSEDEAWEGVTMSEWEDIVERLNQDVETSQNKPNPEGRMPPSSSEKLDPKTVREMTDIYLPTFEANPDLQVGPEVYYESEPDTLSCCSEKIGPEAEARMEKRAWEIKLVELMDMLSSNVGHFVDYAIFDRNSVHEIALSRAFRKRREELKRIVRLLGKMMEKPEEMSRIIQSAREIFLPLGGNIFSVVHLDKEMIVAKKVNNPLEGLVGRSVMGLLIFLRFDSRCHPVVTLDILHSLADYLTFCVFDCLPEYEDGFEEQMALIEDEKTNRGCRKKRNGRRVREWRHEKMFYKSKELFP